ncbi:hypothetical protein BD560DRAFT_487357 [Blakeslea trispora]|nr:hypothetical protein BD560DRAFT_487357 [Blakeslea trispora]
MSTTVHTEKKIRTFSPIILFHDHEYVKAGSGDLEHVHIPYGDPSYGRHLDVHKKRIQEMLETNGRYWLDIISWTRDHPESLDHSPVPSLVSSPSPPHHLTYPYSHPMMLPPTAHYAFNHYYEQSPPPPQIIKEEGLRLRTHHHHKNMNTTTSSHIHQSTMKINHEKRTHANVSIISNKRRRGNLPKAVTAILRDWLSRHKKHPYPTEEEKATLAAETNLNLNQISNWFINARRRILQPMLEQEEEEEHAHLDSMATIASNAGMPVPAHNDFDMMYDDKHSFGK